MSTLNAGMTRDAAFELLSAHNHDPFHIEHAETVEQTMRYFAREYDPENEEFWGIVGLLHDLDWEEHDDEPAMHTLYATPLIEEAGGTPELIHAIQSHTSDYNTDLPKPELMMEKILFATEELTGLIRRRRDHAPVQERHGLQRQVAQEEVQGQALRRRRVARRDPPGRRDAGLGAGRGLRPHHRGHAELRPRPRHLW